MIIFVEMFLNIFFCRINSTLNSNEVNVKILFLWEFEFLKDFNVRTLSCNLEFSIFSLCLSQWSSLKRKRTNDKKAIS